MPFGRALMLGLALAGAALARPAPPPWAECSLDAGAAQALVAPDPGAVAAFERPPAPPAPVLAAVAPVIAAPVRTIAVIVDRPCRGALAPAAVSLDLAPKTSPPAA